MDITLVHDGGDTLAGEDTRITVTYDGDSDSVLLDDIEDFEDGDSWITGERVTLDLSSDGDFDITEIETADGDIEIRVIDDPSGGTISVRTTTVSWNG